MQTHGILALHFLIIFVGLNHGVGALAFSQKDVEIDRYLKQMNKPAVKTIRLNLTLPPKTIGSENIKFKGAFRHFQSFMYHRRKRPIVLGGKVRFSQTIKSPTGDLIDCVDIYKQPSLDHPLLQNHTIQVRNILDPTEVNDPSIEIHQDWHANGKCPEGAIPIRRIRKSDILRASLLEKFGRKSYDIDAHEHIRLLGARADISVWNPRTTSNDFSAAQISVSSGPPLTRVEARWHVFPKLYGDNRTRLFTLWTDNNFETGCYNLLCRGFIQIDNEFVLGGGISPISSYGRTEYGISIKILQDVLGSGQWLLTINGKPIGYWPTEIVPALNNGAKSVIWGGEVQNSNHLLGSPTTQMGSGHFTDEGNGKAAFISNINTFDKLGRMEGTEGVESIASLPKCYDFQFVGGTSNFLYGGPGSNANFR